MDPPRTPLYGQSLPAVNPFNQKNECAREAYVESHCLMDVAPVRVCRRLGIVLSLGVLTRPGVRQLPASINQLARGSAAARLRLAASRVSLLCASDSASVLFGLSTTPYQCLSLHALC
jgi:hypothetical protein